MTPLSVVVADDHEVVRNGVRLLASSLPWVNVVGEAATGLQALAVTRLRGPDVVLMDVEMPGMDGLEATRLVRSEMPDVQVLMYTVCEEEDTVFAAACAGASGYVPKSSGLDELTSAFEAIKVGGAYLTPFAAALALRCLVRRSERALRLVEPADVTSAREREILELLAEGLPARAIAERLGISERTVGTHVGHIYRRLGVSSKLDAVREAVRLGILGAS